MKIRWTENSLRFRITPEELETLRSLDMLSAILDIPNGGWMAFVVPDREHDQTNLIANGNKVFVALALADIARLAEPETEGVYFHMETESGHFRYFIEKDFPCAHPRTGDGEEPVTPTFAPPEGFEERKQTLER